MITKNCFYIVVLRLKAVPIKVLTRNFWNSKFFSLFWSVLVKLKKRYKLINAVEIETVNFFYCFKILMWKKLLEIFCLITYLREKQVLLASRNRYFVITNFGTVFFYCFHISVSWTNYFKISILNSFKVTSSKSTVATRK